MSPEDRTPQEPEVDSPRSVLMADIVNSTSLYERLGDVRARDLVRGGMEVMCTTVEGHGGRVVKTLGDGILACFEGAAGAAAALEMIDRVLPLTLEIRVGVHYGTVIDDSSDIFGDTVNTTARLASAARPSEILLSKQLWAELPAGIRDRGRSIPSIAVKGKREPVEVFSILPQDDDCPPTFVEASDHPQESLPSTRLEISLGEQRLSLEGPGSLLIGRGEECDLRIQHSQASRSHARIFYRAPVFMLEDSSSNGTTVVQDSGAQVLIHRRGTVLFGCGKIYPGSTPGAADALAIDYQIR